MLRFGSVVGDDSVTRFWMRAAAHGRPAGIGRPDNWTHLIHTDDLGSAITAALHAPSGVYNVGAEPVRRQDQAEIYAEVSGGPEATFLGPGLQADGRVPARASDAVPAGQLGGVHGRDRLAAVPAGLRRHLALRASPSAKPSMTERSPTIATRARSAPP